MASDLHVQIEGDGHDLLMLHGGGGGIGDLDALRALLLPGRRVISPDQRGHGRSPGDGEISYAVQARETAAVLDAHDIRAAEVVGWSDGGIVGLLLARDRPDLVHRLVAISANVALDSVPAALTSEARDYLFAMQPADLEMPAGRDALPDAAADWPEVAARLIEMWRTGPELSIGDLVKIAAPVLYLAADRDIVPGEHTLAMFEATPGAQLAIAPAATHRLPQQRPAEVAALIERFLSA